MFSLNGWVGAHDLGLNPQLAEILNCRRSGGFSLSGCWQSLRGDERAPAFSNGSGRSNGKGNSKEGGHR
ncbi:hypothetical protein D3C80_2108930 [compost metagenome]